MGVVASLSDLLTSLSTERAIVVREAAAAALQLS
jgi:hypothetical protein